jgi:hypothetical protein
VNRKFHDKKNDRTWWMSFNSHLEKSVWSTRIGRALTSSRTRTSSPLVTVREQQPWCTLTRMWFTLSENPAPNHQEPDSSKQARVSIPPPNAIRSCVRTMSQDYGVTGPSPGVNQHTYPSSESFHRLGETCSQTSLPRDIVFFLFSSIIVPIWSSII